MRKLALLALVVSAPFANALTFDFTSDAGNPAAKVHFDGTTKTFDFPNASTGFDFLIQSSDNGSLVGLKGNFTGTFTIGTITTVGGLQTAPVTGLGTFSVFDGVNTLSATLDWVSIFSFGTTVGLNDGSAPNLTNITYSGSNSGLNQLKNELSQTMTLTAQFIPSKSLTALTTNGANNNATYSGTFNSVVPEPVSLLAFGALALIARRRKSA